MYQTAPSMWTIGGDKPVILEVPFLSVTWPIKSHGEFFKPNFHSCFPCFSKNSQINFCLYTLLQISDLDEFIFGSHRYIFCGVPPQPNYPPIAVPVRLVDLLKMGGVTLSLSFDRNLTSTLPPTLGIHNKFTTTGCSKGLQGLRFPLDDTGLFTGKWFRRVQVRDSDNIVKPFMHVAIQTTRHYAHLLFCNYLRAIATLYIAIKFGLYLHRFNLCQAY